jgi:hypothetical protein
MDADSGELSPQKMMSLPLHDWLVLLYTEPIYRTCRRNSGGEDMVACS